MDIEKSLARIATAKRLSGHLYDNHVVHECIPSFCDPCSEQMLTERGKLVGPIVHPNTYMCNYRVVHVCTVETCNTTEHGVCRITGACYGSSGVSSYDKMDYRTWRTKTTDTPNSTLSARIYGQEPVVEQVEFKTPKRPYKPTPVSKIQQTVKEMVRKLLYDGCRQNINDIRTKKIDTERSNVVDGYKLQCGREQTPVDLTQISIINHHYKNLNAELLPIEPYNIDKIQHYVYLCKQVCIFVQEYWEKKISFGSVTLATLYAMKQGYRLHDINILPQDLYLIRMLPMKNELSRFSIASKMLTHGQILLEYAYLNAIDRGASTESLQLKLIQKELNDTTLCTMRPANYRKLRKTSN